MPPARLQHMLLTPPSRATAFPSDAAAPRAPPAVTAAAPRRSTNRTPARGARAPPPRAWDHGVRDHSVSCTTMIMAGYVVNAATSTDQPTTASAVGPPGHTRGRPAKGASVASEAVTTAEAEAPK